MSLENVWLGIDIGGTNISFGLVAENGNIRERKVIKTKDFSTLAKVAAAIHEYFIQRNSENQLKGIGVGAPSANAQTGCLHYATNLPWQGLEPIKKIFEDEFQLPVALTNDANAAAFGERGYGAAMGMLNFAVITLGTGVGSGIIVNNEMVVGVDGNAGEFGHTILQPNGRQCGCGRKGCVETYCSAGGIVLTAQEMSRDWMGESELRSLLTTGGPITSKDIYEHAMKDDALAIEVFALTGEILGFALANMVSLLGLEAIFLTGGPTKSGAYLLEPTRQSFNSNVLFYYKDKVEISLSKLPENEVAILGAAALVARQ